MATTRPTDSSCVVSTPSTEENDISVKKEHRTQRNKKAQKGRSSAVALDILQQACVDLLNGKGNDLVREQLLVNKEHLLEALRWSSKELAKEFIEPTELFAVNKSNDAQDDLEKELFRLKRERVDAEQEHESKADVFLEPVSLQVCHPEPQHWKPLVDIFEFVEPKNKRIKILPIPKEPPPNVKYPTARDLLKDGKPRCFDCRRDLLSADPGYSTVRDVCREAINRAEGRLESHRPIHRFPLPPMPFDKYQPTKIPSNGVLLTILEEDPNDPLEEVPGFEYSKAARGGVRVWNIEPIPRYPIEFLYPMLQNPIGQRCSWPAKKDLVYETRYRFDIDDVYDQGMLMVFNCNSRHSSNIAKDLHVHDQRDYNILRKERAYLARSLLEQRRIKSMGGPSHDVGLFDAQQRLLQMLQRFHSRRIGISWDWSPYSQDPTFSSFWVPVFALRALERVEWQDGRFVGMVTNRRRASRQIYPNRSWEVSQPKDGPICFKPDLKFQLWDYEFKKYVWIGAISAHIFDEAHFADQIAYYCDIQNGNHPIQRAMLWDDCFRKVFFQLLQFCCKYNFESHDGLIFADDGWSLYSRTSFGRSQIQPPNLVFKIQGEHYAWWRSPNFFQYKDPIGTAMLLHIESDFVLYGDQSRIEWCCEDRRWDPVVPVPTPLPGWDKEIDTTWLEG